MMKNERLTEKKRKVTENNELQGRGEIERKRRDRG